MIRTHAHGSARCRGPVRAARRRPSFSWLSEGISKMDLEAWKRCGRWTPCFPCLVQTETALGMHHLAKGRKSNDPESDRNAPGIGCHSSNPQRPFSNDAIDGKNLGPEIGTKAAVPDLMPFFACLRSFEDLSHPKIKVWQKCGPPGKRPKQGTFQKQLSPNFGTSIMTGTTALARARPRACRWAHPLHTHPRGTMAACSPTLKLIPQLEGLQAPP